MSPTLLLALSLAFAVAVDTQCRADGSCQTGGSSMLQVTSNTDQKHRDAPKEDGGKSETQAAKKDATDMSQTDAMGPGNVPGEPFPTDYFLVPCEVAKTMGKKTFWSLKQKVKSRNWVWDSVAIVGPAGSDAAGPGETFFKHVRLAKSCSPKSATSAAKKSDYEIMPGDVVFEGASGKRKNVDLLLIPARDGDSEAADCFKVNNRNGKTMHYEDAARSDASSMFPLAVATLRDEEGQAEDGKQSLMQRHDADSLAHEKVEILPAIALAMGCSAAATAGEVAAVAGLAILSGAVGAAAELGTTALLGAAFGAR